MPRLLSAQNAVSPQPHPTQQSTDPRKPGSLLLLSSPGRFIEGNRADVQLLDLVDGANCQGAVIGQRQAAWGKKAPNTQIITLIRWGVQQERPSPPRPSKLLIPGSRLLIPGSRCRVQTSPSPCHTRQGAGSPVRIAIRVEGAHVVHLFQVDVGEDQLVVTAVDDGGAVGAGKHVGGGERAESPQDGGLGPKRHLLSVTQQACRKGAPASGAAATELARAGRQSTTRPQRLGKKSVWVNASCCQHQSPFSRVRWRNPPPPSATVPPERGPE